MQPEEKVRREEVGIRVPNTGIAGIVARQKGLCTLIDAIVAELESL